MIWLFTVHKLTRKIPLMPKSTFHSWFRMPLYKSERDLHTIVGREILTSRSYNQKTQSQVWTIGAQVSCNTQWSVYTISSGTNLDKYLWYWMQHILSLICAVPTWHLLWVYLFSKGWGWVTDSNEEIQRGRSSWLYGISQLCSCKLVKLSMGWFHSFEGKELYPSLVFEWISNYDWWITSVFGPQFGSRNDKHIVKKC